MTDKTLRIASCPSCPFCNKQELPPAHHLDTESVAWLTCSLIRPLNLRIQQAEDLTRMPMTHHIPPPCPLCAGGVTVRLAEGASVAVW